MSNSVEIDASKSVEEGVEKRVSDVFLGLFWRRAMSANITFPEFRELAETWIKTREMEAPETPAGPRHDYKQMYFDLLDKLIEQDVHPVPEPVTDFWGNIPEEVQIDQHTFVSEKDAGTSSALRAPSPQGEGSEPEKKQKSAAKSAAGKSSFARRKQAALEAVKSARASGCTLQGIADQSNLSLTMVMDLINGVSRPVTDWTKLEKGLKKLGHPPRVIPKEEPHEQEKEE